MKLTPAKLTLEDFPNQRDWIGNLFLILNSFTGDVVRGFSNQLTIEENLYQEIREIKWTAGSGDLPLSFQTKFKTAPKGLLPIYLFDQTAGTYSTSQPWFVWSYANGSVSILDVSGLTAGRTYSARILLIYG